MRADQRRTSIAREAARLMLEEGVRQYFDAKRIAARRLPGQRRQRRDRPGDLPSNGEMRGDPDLPDEDCAGASGPWDRVV